VKGTRIAKLRIVVLAIGLVLAAPFARADDMPCSVPDGLAFGDISLPESKSQIAAGKHLAVLVIGGASIGGMASGGRAHSLPMRLEVRLRAAFPGQDITVSTHSVDGGNTRAAADQMTAAIRYAGAKLVVWETGSSAAVAGDDLEMFTTNLESGLNAAKVAHADIILMDLQYAPSIARVMNQTPYCDAIRGAAEMAGVPMLHRFALMHAWSDSGELNLDAANAAERVKVARRVYDCLAGVLANGIVGAWR